MEQPSFETIRVERTGRVARVILNRPEVRNAFDDRMIADLIRAFEAIGKDSAVRAVVISGEGPVFCAGADLAWMRRVVDQDFAANLAESLELARLFQIISRFDRPVVARVQGAAIGGANGLVAASDLAVAAESAVFSLSETRLGIIPAAIGPYIVRRIGEGAARRLFLTGERLDGRRAAEIGLVSRAVPDAELDRAVEETLGQLLAGGPAALAAAKRLLEDIRGLDGQALNEVTARAIAELRVSAEGQEGMRAFLEKRRPAWVEEAEDS